MLSRLIPKKPSHFIRFFSLPSKQHHFPISPINPHFTFLPKPFSTNNNNNDGKDPFATWKNFGESEEKFDNLFSEESGSLAGINEVEGEKVEKVVEEEKWWLEEKGLDNEDEDSLFKGIDKQTEGKGDFGAQIGVGAEHVDQPWNLKEVGGDVFDFKEDDVIQEVEEINVLEGETKEDVEKLEKEEKELTAIIKGLA